MTFTSTSQAPSSFPTAIPLVTLKTKEPWSGEVEVSWTSTVALVLRIPGWANGYTCSVEDGPVKDGYLYLLENTYEKVQVVFNVEARKMYANPRTGKNEVCIM